MEIWSLSAATCVVVTQYLEILFSLLSTTATFIQEIRNREEVAANLHSLIGNAYLEMGDFAKAKEHHKKDREIAQQQ